MYHIIEIQTTGNISTIVQPIPFASELNEAESIFHQKMSYAAISTVPVHSVALLDENGLVLMNGSYKHTQEENENEG